MSRSAARPLRSGIRTTRLLVKVSALALTAAACTAPQPQEQPVPAVPAEPTTRTISFTTSEGTYLSFDISPDGRWIVFDLLGQLWRIPAEGGEAVPLTDAVADQAEDLDPSFSPDGRWIVFQGDRREGTGLWLLPEDGGTPRYLPGTEAALRRLHLPPSADAAWSQAGERLAFIRSDQLQIHDLARGTTAPIELRDRPEGRLQNPIWLQDDRLLVRVAQDSERSGPLWLVDAETGLGEELPVGATGARAAAPSPDGSRLAYFAPDEAGELQLWIQAMAGGEAPHRLTDQSDVLPLRARWSPDGGEILYSAEGRLWAVSPEGDLPQEIPFRARVEFERQDSALPSVRFPAQGDELPVRGFMGLALSPDAERIALIAMNQLWVWPIGGEPEVVADLPASAAHLRWSPDGQEVSWSAGPGGGEDLYATRLGTGQTRRLTALPGYASRPSWSPDGQHIAFIYWPAPESGSSDWIPARFAVIPADTGTVSDTSGLLLLGEELHSLWIFEFFPMGQEVPWWSPGSEALLYQSSGETLLLPLDGEPVPFEHVPGWSTFLHWAADSSLTYVQGTHIWRAEVRDNTAHEPVLLVDEAALYPSVARDGTILYIATDGYRLRRPDGSTHALGWPLSFRIPTAPPLLIRGARIIGGTGAVPEGTSDLLVEDGKIAQVAPGGSIHPEPGVQVLDADGRTLLPGLIDLHVHGWESDDYAASLYHGATTVREMGAPMARAAALAEAAAAGAQPGARALLGGFQFFPGFQSDELPFGAGATSHAPESAVDGDRGLAIAQAFGASYAKLYFPGTWSGGADFIRSAHARGMRIGGHCGYPLPLMAAGIAQVEHLVACLPRSEVPPRDDLLRLYRESGVTIVPTLAAFSGGRRMSTEEVLLPSAPGIAPFLSPFARWWGGWSEADSVLPVRDESPQESTIRAAVRAARSYGILVAAGSDLPVLPGAIHLELEELVRAGLTPMEAIIAATESAARVLGAEEEIGTIEVGKWADLILLDADPLEDIRNTRKIWKVIQGGRVVDREGLIEWTQGQHQTASAQGRS